MHELAGSDFADHLTASNAGDTLLGLGGADRMFGGTGNDTLEGDLGRDVLTGGGGHDTFFFAAPAGIKNADIITDFDVNTDTIALQVNKFNLPAGAVSDSDFVIGPSAQTRNQHIVYNDTTGVLFYDADGSGPTSQNRLADIGAGLALTASNFKVEF